MLVFSVHFGILGSEPMRNKLLILMFACFGLAMMQPAYADEVTQEQVEEVMKKGFKAKLHNVLPPIKKFSPNTRSGWLPISRPKGMPRVGRKRLARLPLQSNLTIKHV